VLGERVRPAQRVAGLAAVAVVELTVSYGRIPWLALLIAASWSLYGLFKRQVPLAPFESLTGETLVLVLPAYSCCWCPPTATAWRRPGTGPQMVSSRSPASPQPCRWSCSPGPPEGCRSRSSDR
jgi:EamA domain-containing membrane protein RarD